MNLLLYAAWLAHLKRGLSADHLVAMEACVCEWREQVVKPLRALRRQLRDYPGAEGARDELKQLELQAEREQQDIMYAFYQRAPTLPRCDAALLENLTRVAQQACPGTSDWDTHVRHLAALIAP